jgi:hypothetical protein
MKVAQGALPGILFAAAAAAQDPAAIVRRSLELDQHNSQLARAYTFLQRVDQRNLDGDGKVKSRTVRTYDITMLEGSPYVRLVQKDDKPLPAAEEKKEQDKLAKNIEQRKKETPEQRKKRLAEADKERESFRKPLLDIPEAFELRLAGTERHDGRELYVIEGKPRPGYGPHGGISRIFPKVAGKLWVDAKSYEWVKAEAEVLDTISFGWFLARVRKGTWMHFEQTWVNEEIWLPKRIEIGGGARVLFKNIRTEAEITFSNYRKFQSDSRILTVEPAP